MTQKEREGEQREVCLALFATESDEKLLRPASVSKKMRYNDLGFKKNDLPCLFWQTLNFIQEYWNQLVGSGALDLIFQAKEAPFISEGLEGKVRGGRRQRGGVRDVWA